MAITNLHDTDWFTRTRVSLSDIVGCLPLLSEEKVNEGRLPRNGFRREAGFFYPFRELQEKLIPHLDSRPIHPSQDAFFVWTLKKDKAFFHQLAKDYPGKNQMVPWWVIKPTLRWQEAQGHNLVIPADGARFFMEAHIAENEKKQVPVSLKLECGTLHSERYLRPAEIEPKTCFQKGSVFLSVA